MTHNIDILVMCGGKCGSSTLYSSFKNSGFKCLKIHSKYDYILQFKSDSLYDTINLSSKCKKLFIIDSYRTPIERKISSFFQNIHTFVPNYEYLSIQKLIHIFNLKYLILKSPNDLIILEVLSFELLSTIIISKFSYD